MSGGGEIAYGYDVAGRLASVAHPELGEVGYGYDPTRWTAWPASPPSPTATTTPPTTVHGATLIGGVAVCVAATFGWCAAAAGVGFAGRSAATGFWGEASRQEKTQRIVQDALTSYVTLGAGALFSAAGNGLRFTTSGGRLIHGDRLVNAAVMDVPAATALMRNLPAARTREPAPLRAPTARPVGRQSPRPFHRDPTRMIAV